MRFNVAVRSATFISAFAVLAGCSGGNELPVGGPYGGSLPQWAIVDGGLLGDGSGVLPVSETNTAAIGGTPTWTELYTSYMAAGTIGNCVTCHSEMTSAPASFSWLQSQGYVGAAQPELTDGTSSCLSWFGGDMPPGGPTASSATKDFTLWAAAGATND